MDFPVVTKDQCRGYRLDAWSRKMPWGNDACSPQLLSQLVTTAEAHVPESLCSATGEATEIRSPHPQPASNLHAAMKTVQPESVPPTESGLKWQIM